MGKCIYPRGIRSNDIKIVEDENNERQYMITVELQDEGESILIISNHPRRVNDKYCNKVIKRALRYLYSKMKKNFPYGIRKVSIVNIISQYDLEESNKDFINYEYLNQGIAESDTIIAAWGKPCKEEAFYYGENIKNILKRIREEFLISNLKKQFLKIGLFTLNGYPKHVLAWRYDDELNSYYN